MREAEHLWTSCRESLRAQVSDAVWSSTFQDVTAVGLRGDQLVIAVPNPMAKDRIEQRYRSLVEGVLRDVDHDTTGIEIEVRTAAAAPSVVPDPLGTLLGDPPELRADPDRPSRPAVEAAPSGNGSGRLPGPSQDVDPRSLTFDAFVTGAGNRFAHAAALAVAETPGRAYNPLFIYGDAGLGKTHLLQAIAHYVRKHYPGYLVRYVSSETFLNDFVESIRTNTGADFKKKYRDVDLLLVDDIQFVEGKEGFQEELFHTFNALWEERRQIVLSSDRPPDAIETLENRLRSRFKMGLITDIQPPDLETRLAILRRKAEAEPRPIPDDILSFIASNITDNIRELEGALNRVSALANLVQEPLTLEAAEKHLHDILGERQPRPITPALIIQATADMFDFTVDEIKGKSRQRPLVNARQIAMYVFREVTDLSYPAIAREFGGRDHTTVIHAVEKIKALMKERRQIYDQVSELVATIRKGG